MYACMYACMCVAVLVEEEGLLLDSTLSEASSPHIACSDTQTRVLDLLQKKIDEQGAIENPDWQPSAYSPQS